MNNQANVSQVRVKSKTLSFRKEQFTIEYQYYFDEEEDDEFVTPEMNDANLNQVYNLFRIKHSIPFPEEIKKIRQNYGLSAAKMSEVLSFGPNSYRLYEAGEMPSASNARLIKVASDPEAFQKFLLNNSVLTDNEMHRLNERIKQLIEEKKSHIVNKDEYIMDGSEANEYTGYKLPDLEKALNVIIYFAETLKPWQTALNKLMFYADFGHCKTTGQSITGLSYRAITYGVVPKNYGKLFSEAVDQNLVNINYHVFENSANVCQQYVSFSESNSNFNSELFNKSELDILQKISNKFAGYSASDIVKMNHEEKAWLENFSDKGLVSYKNSFHLQHL